MTTTTMRRRTTKQDDFVPRADGQAAEPEQLIGNVRSLLAEAQALSARLAALNEIAVAMQASMDTGAMLRVMARQARWVVDFQHCAVVTRERTGYNVHVLLGADTGTAGEIDRLTARAIEQGHALLAGDLTAADGAPAEMRSALVLPLRNAQRIIGTLNFYTRAPNHYNQHDLRIASALTLQVAAILQNERLLAAVRSARDELHTVLESISDGVLVLDRSGRIVLLNRAFQQLLGCTPSAIIGQRALKVLRHADPQRPPLLDRAARRELWRELWRAMYRGDSSAPTPSHTLALSNGCHAEWASAPLMEAGVTVGYVLTLREVSARVALDQLREDLTQMLVHDLRSPLTSIMMGLDMLRLDFMDAEDHAATVRQTRQAAQRMLEQVNTLLDVNKLEAGRLELDLAIYSAPMLAEAVITPLLPLATRSAQTITLSIGDGLPVFLCDARLMRRVLQNLLDNALKFTPLGGTIVIGAHYNRDKELIELWVQDSGPGVPEAMHAQVFEKYGQASGERRGTGLGLTFARLVVEAHGGQIGIRAAPERGSVFWFTLPLATHEEHQATQRPNA